MAHVAELNENNVVIRVIVVHNDYEANAETWAAEWAGGGVWKQTSYNGSMRGVFAGIGYTYNEEEDIFIEPQPYPSWTRQGSFWIAPLLMPNDDNFYYWDESIGNWIATEL